MIFTGTKLEGAFIIDIERREGLVEGCKVKRGILKDAVLTYDDVELPKGRLADSLRAEQYLHFRQDGWLQDHLLRGGCGQEQRNFGD